MKINYKTDNKPQTKKTYISQNGSRCQSLEYTSEDTSNDSFHADKNQFHHGRLFFFFINFQISYKLLFLLINFYSLQQTPRFSQ